MGSVQNLKTILSTDLISPEVSAKVEANQLTKNTEIIAKMAFANYEVLYHQDTGIPHLFKKLGPNETDDPEIAKLKQQYQIRFQPKKGGIGKELKPEYFNPKIQAKFAELVKEMQVDLKDGTLLIPEKAADGSIKKDASGKEIYHPTHLTPDALMAALVVSKKVKHKAPFVLSIEMNGRKGQENETVQLQCVVDSKGNRHLVQIIEHLATGGSNEIYKCWETYTNSISVYKHSDTEAPKNLSYEEAVNIHKAYGKKKGSVTGLQDRPHLYWQ